MTSAKERTKMTFRKMTFLFISFILSLLFILQLALIQNYSKDVSSKIGEAAFQVSRSTIEKLLFGQPSNQFKAFAFSTRISRVEREMMVQSISNISNDINISLNDGQKDKFIAINSGGTKLLVDIPRTGITDSLDSMLEKLLISSLAFIFFGIFVANYFAKKLAQPLKELEHASHKVGKGEFGFQIKNEHRFQSVEIKNAVNAFNKMSKQILKLQNENDILQKQAQHSELSEITRGLAHTIRNPLNTLNLAIDELASTSDGTLKTKLSNVSKKQIQRIDKWVRSMMDIMASDKNITELVDLSQLLKSCIDDKVLLESQTIKIELIIDGDNNFFVKANKVELKSLINGLLSNAIEASQSIGNAEDCDDYLVKIVLSNITLKNRTNNIYQISILDRGTGLSKNIMLKLFSPHNTNKTYGAGMGLYLAHRVITLKYQGSISITNNPESLSDSAPGTKIVLTLQDRV